MPAFVSQSCGRLIRSDFIPSWDQIFVKSGTRRNSELCARCRKNAFQVKSNVFMSPQKSNLLLHEVKMSLTVSGKEVYSCQQICAGQALIVNVRGDFVAWLPGPNVFVAWLPGCRVQMFSLPGPNVFVAQIPSHLSATLSSLLMEGKGPTSCISSSISSDSGKTTFG